MFKNIKNNPFYLKLTQFNINKKDIIILLICLITACLLSLSNGADRGFDARNYHIYNPYAFLNNRFNIDIMPAGLQSYFNPLIDIPYFLIIKYFNHALFVNFISGTSYGIFLFLIYKLSDFIFKDSKNKNVFVLLSVILGGITDFMATNNGSLSNDIFIADIILLSILLIFKSFKNYKPKLMIISGLLIGIAIGLRFATVCVALPLILCCFIFFRQFEKPQKQLLFFIISIVIGFFMIEGFWMIKLYKVYQNPLMPYFNQIFNSKYISAPDIYRIDFTIILRRTGYLTPFLSYPLTLMKILIIMFIINFIYSIDFKHDDFFTKTKINYTYIDFMFTFACIAYILFIEKFATPRYLISVYALIGIIVICVAMKIDYILRKTILKKLNKICPESEKIRNLTATICTLLIFFYCYSDFKNIIYQPRKGRIYSKEKALYVKDMQLPDNAIVLVTHGSAILVPFQNKKASYIHVNSYFFTLERRKLLSKIIIEEIKEKLRKNPDKIYILTDIFLPRYRHIPQEKLIEIFEDKRITRIPNKMTSKIYGIGHATMYELAKYDIDIQSLQCSFLKTNFEPIHYYYLCKAEIK